MFNGILYLSKVLNTIDAKPGEENGCGVDILFDILSYNLIFLCRYVC